MIHPNCIRTKIRNTPTELEQYRASMYNDLDKSLVSLKAAKMKAVSLCEDKASDAIESAMNLVNFILSEGK